MAKLLPAQSKVLLNAFTAAWSKMDLPRWTSPQSDRPIDISDEEIIDAFARVAKAHSLDLVSVLRSVSSEAPARNVTARRRAQVWMKWAALAVVTTQAAELASIGDEDDLEAMEG